MRSIPIVILYVPPQPRFMFAEAEGLMIWLLQIFEAIHTVRLRASPAASNRPVSGKLAAGAECVQDFTRSNKFELQFCAIA
jgi:hypothetical protein